VFGEVTITFNTDMKTTEPKITVSEINDTIIEMYVKPTDNWHKTKLQFDRRLLNFTWKCLSYEGDTMILKLNFTNPIIISPEKL
jgi:hypothetical protein